MLPKNIKQQNFKIKQSHRKKLFNQRAICLWFTGLSGSGKSTIANELEQQLFKDGIKTYILDGDNLRLGLNKDLSFTDADRVENIRRTSEVAKLMVDAGLVVLVTLISPYAKDRQMAREKFKEGEFLEVFINTPLKDCEARDPKGLYKKARAGLIKNFTGIDSAYEKPTKPEIIISTEMAIEKIIQKILKKIA